MSISFSGRFDKELKEVLRFIGKDSKTNAKAFKARMFERIYKLPNMPFACRQSLKSDDENVRDLVFEGYVIPYRIKGGILEMLGVFGANEWEMKEN